jgi:hypothetical protein
VFSKQELQKCFGRLESALELRLPALPYSLSTEIRFFDTR